ncbi:MAG: hypothetical protein LBO62_06280 [Endomicrobium sp.]|nr:hypothetical protein [Endomicrobium sp.]
MSKKDGNFAAAKRKIDKETRETSRKIDAEKKISGNQKREAKRKLIYENHDEIDLRKETMRL